MRSVKEYSTKIIVMDVEAFNDSVKFYLSRVKGHTGRLNL